MVLMQSEWNAFLQDFLVTLHKTWSSIEIGTQVILSGERRGMWEGTLVQMTVPPDGFALAC